GFGPLGRERPGGGPTGPTDAQRRLDFEPGSPARGQRANRLNSSAADEERLPPARLGSRGDQADLEPAQPLETAQALDHVLEGLDAVAEAGGLFVAQLVGQAREPCAQTRQRPAREQAVELTSTARGKRPRS